MEVDGNASPSDFDPDDVTMRELFRRYGKRHSGASPSPEQSSASKSRQGRLLYDGPRIHKLTNAALVLEDIKQEAVNFESDYSEKSPAKRRFFGDGDSALEADADLDSGHKVRSYSLKVSQQEEDSSSDVGESMFSVFASLLDSSLQGVIPIPYLILRFEEHCRSVSATMRYGFSLKHRAVEDKLMRQKAQLLVDEAATWSLLWYLYGKGKKPLARNEEMRKDLFVSPTTSHIEACQFVSNEHVAQLCLRVVQWLEELASKALDMESKIRGSHVGTYLPYSGIWNQTQRFLKKGASDANTIHHLDFDAPTRQNARQLPEDKKQDDSLLEDVWTLVRAGKIQEACDLCRSAGQPWRAASLCPFGGLNLFPSGDALLKNGKNRVLQAIELESGIGHQWQLWKWASYCASERISEQDGCKYEAALYAANCSNLKRILPTCTDWESACWAMAKSWLDVLVDIDIARLQPEGMTHLKSYEDDSNGSPDQMEATSVRSVGSHRWPVQVLKQQPRSLSSLFQKLHSGDAVHEAVIRGCKEQHRQIEMKLMEGNIPQLLDLIWLWIAPSGDDPSMFRPHGDPQMIRFGAHLVIVLRYLLADEVKDAFKEKLMTVGDFILHMYAMFLFSKHHEELVGIYASQLAGHRCVDLFVHMMELRLSSSIHVKYKIFLSAIEYLPYTSSDDSRGSFEEIIERVLSRSREIISDRHDDSSEVAEQHRQESLRKAMAVQWLCFTPPTTIRDVEDTGVKLLVRALMHSNVLFREFALISMWRVPAMPIGAHKLLGYLAEPLNQLSENLDTQEDPDIPEHVKEFNDWNEYYSCDSKYRHWLEIEVKNAEASLELSSEERDVASAAARDMLVPSISMLSRKNDPWLVNVDDGLSEEQETLFIELHAAAVLCLPSGESLCPDPSVCASLMSALYSSVSEEEVLKRQLTIDVRISSANKYCIEVVLRCTALIGDGLGPTALNDGGILAGVMAAGFKGELDHFQSGVTLEISRLDAWYSSEDGSLQGPAPYIIRGLCHRCCIPELILRCMEVLVSLVKSEGPQESHNGLIDLVTSPETGFFKLFSQHQLQEFLLFEREYSIYSMELQEGTVF
ncbi:hypothetical protein MLD38_030775 [Melastoma candidum]|uniref:Uncharacterized protein n=1 Tax=Melastoma candidum TaxID=119954 RepID=A0ACB9MSS6_9MYRT|nr:hypothetical protein MLD38_030775 [Melastoma candidum]